MNPSFTVRTVAVAVVVLVFSLGASSSFAQQGLYYEPPGGSPFSPYMNLFRRNNGLLNPYFNYIVPQRRLEATLRQQNTAIGRLQTDFQGVQGELRQVQMTPIGPTGVGSGFMNYSHFYPSAPR